MNKAPRKVLHFDLGKGNQLNVKIAFSTVSVEGAKANMEAELSHWNFAKVRKAAGGRVAEVSVFGESDRARKIRRRTFILPCIICLFSLII